MTVRLCSECGEAEALPRKQRCEECDLAAQPVMVRVAAAEARLALVPPDLRRQRVSKDEWPEGRRWCAGCQSFVRLRDCSATGTRCTTCTGIAGHLSAIQAKYDISPDQWNALMNRQAGRCAICRNRPKKARLSVDHDHGTGEVRGLLCSRCNDELLGAMYHKPEIAVNAYWYLTTPPNGPDWVLPETRNNEPEPAPY